MPGDQRHIINENFRGQTEVDELISVPPGCLLHSGIMMIGLVVFSLLALSAFIRYPDKILTQGILTSTYPPIEHYNKEGGRIESVFVTEGQRIKEGQPLIYIYNTANRSDIKTLKLYLHKSGKIEGVLAYLNLDIPEELELGEVQSEFASWELTLNEFKTTIRGSTVFKQIETLEQEIAKTKLAYKVLQKELKLSKEELALKEKDFERNKTLNNEGVVSDVDLENARITLLSYEKQYNNLTKGIIENEIRSEQLALEIHKLSAGRQTVVNNYIFKLDEIRSELIEQIKIWDEKYYVRSSMEGIVTIPSYIVEDGPLRANMLVASIIPQSQESKSYAEVICPQRGVGKINLGQKAIIKVDGYPYKEYGILKSKVGQVAPVPSKTDSEESYYTIEIPMHRPLITSYGDTIPFKPNMPLTAEIITKEKTILERVFEQFLTALNR